ncbi:hypothetical protein [Actinokineospora terrae]|uniref:Uncharacterized protein n=1 Tax=Actinokineospora terrae TaxID=155974 RepID=A0A1H9T6M9_9PSEU|nr:hypothetical protein [Actinokineospora terrae]SER92747.1 hypothetical protein SAMN04487818_10693 [Actinokineospora terrae]
MNTLFTDPATLLAAIRATAGLALERIDPRAVDSARRSAESAGRTLVPCRTGATHKRSDGRGLALGWLPQSTPAPEESQEYPVRNLSPVARVTWACCLGLAWPDRTAAPYPGEPFTTSEVLDVAGELGVTSMWVKIALFRTLAPSRLVVVDGTTLYLGPATAALPGPFVDALRRFHDRLPRLDSPPAAHHDAELDDEELADLELAEEEYGTSVIDAGLFNDDDADESSDDDSWDE